MFHYLVRKFFLSFILQFCNSEIGFAAHSLFLVLSHECIKRRSSFVLLLVELVDNDANKKVECEEASEDDEEDKVHVHVDAVLAVRLLVKVHHVDGIVHDIDPSLKSDVKY